MSNISMKELLESGVHFGHQTARWNPKMKNYIYTKRNGIHIINLQITIEKAIKAYQYVKNETAKGKTILFVGTKKQNKESIKEYSSLCESYYITHRWLGGMLTNFKTIKKRLNYLKELQEIGNEDGLKLVTKKEINKANKKRAYLEKILSSIQEMETLPDMIFILDIMKDHIALSEAKKLNIPVIALVDSNTNPELVDYPIPANDDAIRSTNLFLRYISDAVIKGKQILEKTMEKENIEPSSFVENVEDVKKEKSSEKENVGDAKKEKSSEKEDEKEVQHSKSVEKYEKPVNLNRNPSDEQKENHQDINVGDIKNDGNH